jgi:hypothetical protein
MTSVGCSEIGRLIDRSQSNGQSWIDPGLPQYVRWDVRGDPVEHCLDVLLVGRADILEGDAGSPDGVRASLLGQVFLRGVVARANAVRPVLDLSVELDAQCPLFVAQIGVEESGVGLDAHLRGRSRQPGAEQLVADPCLPGGLRAGVCQLDHQPGLLDPAPAGLGVEQG